MSTPDFFDPDAFLARWTDELTEAQQRLADDFLAGRVPRYALGRNEVSLLLAGSIPLDGILDDYAEGGSWEGLPLLKEGDLAADGIIINTVLMARPVSASRRLHALSGVRVLEYADLLRASPGRFPLPQFVAESRSALRTQGADFLRLHGLFEDAASRQTFEDAFRYRLTADPKFMRGYAFRVDAQYFEDFCPVPPGAVFIDAGGYHGETSIEFARRYPQYGQIHVFEPAPANLARCTTALQGERDIVLHPVGLSDSTETLRFAADAGSASKISDEGSETIEVAKLDERVAERVDFVKMDLEGWELRALMGAREAIARHHPVLAISAYHHPLDFVRIHAWVTAQRDDYDVFLRHYTEGWIETVLYFIPRGKGGAAARSRAVLGDFSVAELHAEICRRKGEEVDFGQGRLAVSADLGGAIYHTDGAWMDFNDGLYDEIRTALDPALIVDIGANMGFTSVCYGTHFPGARIIAVEPNPALSALYHRNMRLNRIENYELLVKSAGDANTPLAFSCPAGFSVDAKVADPQAATAPPAFQADQITLDQLLEDVADETAVFIKVDAQGYDFNIMRGGGAFFSRNRRHLVRIEFAPAWLEQQGADSEAFLVWMTERFSVAELPPATFGRQHLGEVFTHALRPQDAAAFVSYTKARSRHGRGHVDLLLKPRAMVL